MATQKREGERGPLSPLLFLGGPICRYSARGPRPRMGKEGGSRFECGRIGYAVLHYRRRGGGPTNPPFSITFRSGETEPPSPPVFPPAQGRRDRFPTLLVLYYVYPGAETHPDFPEIGFDARNSPSVPSGVSLLFFSSPSLPVSGRRRACAGGPSPPPPCL